MTQSVIQEMIGAVVWGSESADGRRTCVLHSVTFHSDYYLIFLYGILPAIEVKAFEAIKNELIL